MPYTAAQLTQYYTAVNQGQAPDQATQLQFQAAAQQNANGQLSDAATLRLALGSGQTLATTDVALATYQFFTGTAPTAAGLTYLVTNPGTGFNTSYFNGTGQANGGAASATNPGAGGFNLENRYYNESIALASTGGAGNTSFVANYGTLTINQTIAAAYETIVGSANVGQANANAAIASIQSSVSYFTQVAQQRAGGVDAGGAAGQNIALKAIIVGYILEEGLKADVGTYAKAIDQFNASVANSTAVYNTNLLTYYGPNGAGFGTGVGAGATTTTTFNFTNQPDNPAGGGSIFYNAVVDGAAGGPTTTLTAQDTLAGTGGNNTLRVTTVNGYAGDVLDGALVSGVQTLSVRNIGGATVSFKYSGSQGGQSTNALTTVESFLSTSAVTFGTGAAADALANGVATQVVGNSAVGNGNVTSNYATGVTAQTLNLKGGTTQGTVTINGGTAATLTVNTTDTLDNLTALVANAAGKLIINATTGFTAAVSATAITDLTVSGAGAVTFGAGTSFGANLKNVTSTNTNALTATFDGTSLQTVTLASGGDNITINNAGLSATSNVNLGDGNDTLTLTATPTAGVTITGGNGLDTLNVLAATAQAFANPATFTTAQAAQISGFETLGITDKATTGTYNPSVIGASNITFNAGVTTGGTATVGTAGATGGLTSGSTVGLGGDTNTNNGAVVINVTNATAAASTSDAVTLAFTNTTALTNAISAPGVEAITVNATGTGGATLNLTDAALKTLVISTSENFIVGSTGSTVLTSITDSGAGNFTFTASANANLTSIDASGSTGIDTINVAAATNTNAAALVVKGGSASDVFTVKDFAIITTGAQAAGGGDTVNVNQTTNGNSYSIVTDATKGDDIHFAIAPTSYNATPIALQGNALFADYLNAAAGGAGNGNVSVFTFGGNTFLVEDNSAQGTFLAGTDNIVELQGTHTVSLVGAELIVQS